MTQKEKQEVFDWFLLNFDSYVHCYAYTASGEQIEVDEPLEENFFKKISLLLM